MDGQVIIINLSTNSTVFVKYMAAIRTSAFSDAGFVPFAYINTHARVWTQLYMELYASTFTL